MSINTSKESDHSSDQESQHASHNSISKSILNVILVFIESGLTLALRFDPKLRQVAYPLAKANIVVCVRTYLPHTQVYATFTQKGILLDNELPAGCTEPDVVINAYSTQLINLMLSHDVKLANKVPMRGQQDLIEQVRAFLLQLGVGSFIQGLIKNFKNKKSSQTDKERESKHSIEDYQAQLKKKQAQLEVLTIKNRELEVSRKEIESKQKTLLIALGVTALIALVCLVGWIM